MSKLIARTRTYFKNIWLDYYEVFKEARQGARARPLRATTYGLTTVFVLNLFRTNEDLRSYRAEVISACNRLGAVVEGSRNARSNSFIQHIGELNCHGLLRQIDLGFSTLVYRADSSPEVALYKYNTPHLRPTIKEFLLDRIVDFGMLGHWLLLETKMKDYDINEQEYESFVKP